MAHVHGSPIHECRNWEQRPRSFISGNICFEFSVQCGEKGRGRVAKARIRKIWIKAKTVRKSRNGEGGRGVKEDGNKGRKRGRKERK
jgi:hypothetical protein